MSRLSTSIFILSLLLINNLDILLVDANSELQLKGKKTVKKYRVYGKVPPGGLCFDLAPYCGDGQEESTTCKAAIATLEKATVAYGLITKLVVRQDYFGNINKVNLKTVAAAGALAISFDSTKDELENESSASANAVASVSNSDETLFGEGSGEGSAIANATVTSESNATSVSGGGSASFTGVFVKGSAINTFGGIVSNYIGAFAGADSSTNAVSMSDLAAEAFASASATFEEETPDRRLSDFDELAEKFGEDFATAVEKIQVYSFVHAFVKDTGGRRGVIASLSPFLSGKPAVSVKCA